MSAFLPRYDQLPEQLPIFPLPGALLLPGGDLPLRIFEPRYLAMVDEALKSNRLIGMIQPLSADEDAPETDKEPTYDLGCAGRITSFTETDEGHYAIDLTGVARFRVVKECTTDTPFRLVYSDFSDFRKDLEEAGRARYGESDTSQDQVTPQMLATIRRYFEHQGIEADLDAISKAPVSQLVTALSMSCPFDTLEKQALLEADNAAARTTVLTSLMEMAAVDMGEATNLN